MAGWIDLRVDLVVDGMRRYQISNPVFERPTAVAASCDSLTFQGASIDQNIQDRSDPGIQTAYAQACRRAIRHLKRFGYSGDQAYALLAAAPVEGRISGMAGHAEVCCTLSVPTGMFDFEAEAMSEAPATPRGELARPS